VTLLRGPEGGAAAGHEVASQEDASFWVGLARRIGHGDRDAEAELARAFHRRVRLMASVRLHGSDAALDIAQETILAVLETLRDGRLRELERLPAFVLSVARNLINNHLRAEARSREVLGDPPDRTAEAGSGLTGLDEERRSLVRGGLKRLNQLDRKILLLTLVEGMTPREIAPIVGREPETVRTRKARAVRAVSREIRRLTRTRRWSHIGKSGLKP